MPSKLKSIGYSNYKRRGMEKLIDIVKNMGVHLNAKHHMTVHKNHHYDADSPR